MTTTQTATATITRTATVNKKGMFTYTVAFPDGKVIVKNFRKEFSHGILCFNTARSWWGVHGFASNLTLAGKPADYFAGGTLYTLHIVTVEVEG